MSYSPIIGLPPDDTEFPPQIRTDCVAAINLLMNDGKMNPDTCFEFVKDARGKVKVRFWMLEPKTGRPYAEFYADPKDVIVGAGPLDRVRGISE